MKIEAAKPCVVSTKCLPDWAQNDIEQAGFSLFQHDFIATAAIAVEWGVIHEFLVFTSQQAVQYYVKQNSAKRPCFCVGQQTSNLLQKLGFEVVAMAFSAQYLGELLQVKYYNGSFTFVCGVQRRPELPYMLDQMAVTWNQYPIYETIATPVEAPNNPSAVLFFSPSAVASFQEKNALYPETPYFCVGATTAQSLREVGSFQIYIADKPDTKVLINLLIQHLKTAC
ncbi:MAG: hypothetical protein CFE24_11205 [Flavobacterium sp. BFFFF2]|nr:MAG: hypothetical protein CFE24_11205 [Flavobacterium sp. BFFFF2]